MATTERPRRPTYHDEMLSGVISYRFPFIRAWAQWQRRNRYRVWQELMIAEAENAPGNAIYRNQDGSWATLDGVHHPGLREFLEKLAGSWR